MWSTMSPTKECRAPIAGGGVRRLPGHKVQAPKKMEPAPPTKSMLRRKPRSATYHHTEVAVGRRRRARHRLVHRIRQRQVNELVIPAERSLNAPVTVELHCRAERAERHIATATTESTAKVRSPNKTAPTPSDEERWEEQAKPLPSNRLSRNSDKQATQQRDEPKGKKTYAQAACPSASSRLASASPR